MQIKSLLLSSLFLLFWQLNFAQENCQIKKEQGEIIVRLCENDDSPFKLITVDFEAKTTLKNYVAGILDINRYHEWQYNILNTEVLETIGSNEVIYYSEADTPWPVSNRDVIFHLTVSQDSTSKIVTVTLTQLPDFIPHKKGIIRIPKAESTLTLVPLDATHVKVNYTLHVDPGGEIPPFIANMFAAQTPWQTFSNFRDRLHAENFSKVDVSFISNYNP